MDWDEKKRPFIALFFVDDAPIIAAWEERST